MPIMPALTIMSSRTRQNGTESEIRTDTENSLLTRKFTISFQLYRRHPYSASVARENQSRWGMTRYTEVPKSLGVSDLDNPIAGMGARG